MTNEAASNESQGAEISRIVRAINDAWTGLEPDQIADAIRPHFRDDAAIAGQGATFVAAGGDAAAASYADFRRQARLLESRFEEPAVRVWGHTAVAMCAWDVSFVLRGDSRRDTGCDVFVFTREADGAWRVAFRAVFGG